MRGIALGLASVALVAGGGCAAQQAGSAPPMVMGDLKTGTGANAGHAMITQTGAGLEVMVDVVGLPAGEHGAHIHMTGKCDGPDFTTAGGHWNPTAMHHGSMNPQGPHQGDLPNLTVGADGKGSLSFTIPGGTVAGLMDTDGAALVIHAAADDLKTDPSGNSGARIACAVLE